MAAACLSRLAELQGAMLEYWSLSGLDFDVQVNHTSVKGAQLLRQYAQRCSSSLFATVLANFKAAGSKLKAQVLFLMHR